MILNIRVSISLVFLLGLLPFVSCKIPIWQMKSVSPRCATAPVRSIAILPLVLPKSQVSHEWDEEARQDHEKYLRAAMAELGHGVKAANPSVSVVAGLEVQERLATAGLAAEFDRFANQYAETGMPVAELLQPMAAALKVDAILLTDFWSRGGRLDRHFALRCVLVSPRDGRYCWEVRAGQARNVLIWSVEEVARAVIQALPPISSGMALGNDQGSDGTAEVRTSWRWNGRLGIPSTEIVAIDGKPRPSNESGSSLLLPAGEHTLEVKCTFQSSVGEKLGSWWEAKKPITVTLEAGKIYRLDASLPSKTLSISPVPGPGR